MEVIALVIVTGLPDRQVRAFYAPIRSTTEEDGTVSYDFKALGLPDLVYAGGGNDGDFFYDPTEEEGAMATVVDPRQVSSLAEYLDSGRAVCVALGETGALLGLGYLNEGIDPLFGHTEEDVIELWMEEFVLDTAARPPKVLHHYFSDRDSGRVDRLVEEV